MRSRAPSRLAGFAALSAVMLLNLAFVASAAMKAAELARGAALQHCADLTGGAAPKPGDPVKPCKLCAAASHPPLVVATGAVLAAPDAVAWTASPPRFVRADAEGPRRRPRARDPPATFAA